MILFKDEMLPLSLLCAGEKQGSGAEATGRLSVDSVDAMTVQSDFRANAVLGIGLHASMKHPPFRQRATLFLLLKGFSLLDWFLDFLSAPGQVPGFACVLCVRHPIFREIRRMFPGSNGRALPLAPIGH